MNTSHLMARDVEAYALSTPTVAPKGCSQERRDHRSTYSLLGRRGSRTKASAELKAAVIWVIAITAWVCLLFASLKFGTLGGVEALSLLSVPAM
jgi:hypothetical protein